EGFQADGGAQDGVVRSAGEQPAFGGGGQVGFGLPDGPGYGQPGQRLVRLDDLDHVRGQAKAVADIGEAHHQAGAGGGGEHEADRVLTVADRQRVDLATGTAGGDGGADLEHVRAENFWLAGTEMVGVVLHEGGPALPAR